MIYILTRIFEQASELRANLTFLTEPIKFLPDYEINLTLAPITKPKSIRCLDVPGLAHILVIIFSSPGFTKLRGIKKLLHQLKTVNKNPYFKQML